MSRSADAGAAAPALTWEPDLCARVVSDALARLAASGRGMLAGRYRRAADRLYALDPEERAAAFADLDARTAEALELDAPVREEAAATPWPGPAPGILLAPAARPAEEGADLDPAADPARPRVVLRLSPSRFAAPAELALFARHELAHARDLCDPAFGYRGDRRVGDGAIAEEAARARYRALWCASLDLRLARARRMPRAACDARMAALRAAFGVTAEGSLRDRLASRALEHATLLGCARDPAALGDLCPGARVSAAPAARTRCPLCSLPAWPAVAPGGDLPEAVRAAIRADLPGWTPDDGLCGRCREVYLTAHPTGDIACA